MPSDPSNLYEPYEKLVKLSVLGRDFHVPEKNTLLRAYQFLDAEATAMGNFCWNGDCHNCQVTLRRDGIARVCLSCQTIVQDGDSLEHISQDVKQVLKGVLKK